MQWFKERTEIGSSDSHYLTVDVHGVCTLDINSCQTSDTAVYRCLATNPLGSDETSCFMHVDGNIEKDGFQ